MIRWKYSSKSEKVRLSNTIDFINPVIGDPLLWNALFGEAFGTVFHAIAMVAKNRGWLLGRKNLEAILSMTNLCAWSEDNYWGEATAAIEKYLQDLRVGGDKKTPELRHVERVGRMYDCTHSLRSQFVFSQNPEIT